MEHPRPAAEDRFPVSVTGEAPPPGWGRLLADADRPSLLQDPAWSLALARHLPDRRPVWLLLGEAHRPLAGWCGLVRRRGPLETVELQYAGLSGAPLLARDLDPGDRAAVLAALATAWTRRVLASRRRVRSVVSLPPPWDAELAGPLRRAGFRRREEATAAFDLTPGLDRVEREQFRKNRRNERNRSLRRGATVAATTDPAVLEPFLAVYRRSARRWGVTPPPAGLLADLLAAGAGRVFLTVARHGDTFLGAHFLLQEGETAIAWLGATVDDHPDLFPATLLVWGDLQEAAARGCRILDLGGHGGQEGVARFKRMLGAAEVPRGLWVRERWPVNWLAAWRRRRGA